MQKLSWKLNTPMEKAGLKIIRLLQKQKFQAFFVGGWVRDRLLGHGSDNLDVATDCVPDEVEKILGKAQIRYKTFGKKFGTIMALPDDQKVEITTFRRESRYSDQRHPDAVEFIRNYLDDAKRRDLTINALYFDPVSGLLFDPAKGLEDLNNKIIRFVGDPKNRIDEDPLRMLRAVRLCVLLSFSAGGGPASGWKFEKNSFAAIKTRAKLIQSVSPQRVQMELSKLMNAENEITGKKLLQETGLAKFIL